MIKCNSVGILFFFNNPSRIRASCAAKNSDCIVRDLLTDILEVKWACI